CLTFPSLPSSTLFPYTTLFRSQRFLAAGRKIADKVRMVRCDNCLLVPTDMPAGHHFPDPGRPGSDDWDCLAAHVDHVVAGSNILDRKSTRLNSSHVSISYDVFC